MIKRIKNTVPWTYTINNLNGKEIVGNFLKKNRKKQIKKTLELKNQLREKVISYIKWEGYNNSFNSRIDKKDIV